MEEKNKKLDIQKAYGNDEEELNYAKKEIEIIQENLVTREKGTLVSNGIPYSEAYVYNQQKAINYAPPKKLTKNREMSFGIPHEKIISFISIFLKTVFKRTTKCYNNKGDLVKRMGEVYDLAIEHSYKLEKMDKKIAMIYWETFSQGDCFVIEDWEVHTYKVPKAYNKSKEGTKSLVTPDTMDYTYEYLDNLEYEEGELIQVRRAVSKLADGREIIFGNPEIDEVQDQPRIDLEREITRDEAEKLFGTLKRWKYVPKNREDITTIIGDKSTLFDVNRLKDPAKQMIVHLSFNKDTNRFNIYLNGLMMLSRKTPMSIFYPRMNYPISRVPAERVKGSIYSRSIPAKTKFNGEYIDWALKKLSYKFEQGLTPAILTKGKYVLTSKMFDPAQVTHNVSRDDYEKADPDNKGITTADFSFVKLMKEILESMTINPTTSGELSTNVTATEISSAQANQAMKLAYLLDGITNGFMDMALRRAETIESKYTIKQKETIVDGKNVPVYQNFTVNVGGSDNVVNFDDRVGTEGYDEEEERAKLFKKSFNKKKDKSPTKYYLVNPKAIRERKYALDIEVKPERMKDTQLELIQMWDDFTQLLNTFGERVNVEVLQKEYLEISGKPDNLFQNEMYKKLQQEEIPQPYNTGSFGRPQKPTVKIAQNKELKVT